MTKKQVLIFGVFYSKGIRKVEGKIIQTYCGKKWRKIRKKIPVQKRKKGSKITFVEYIS